MKRFDHVLVVAGIGILMLLSAAALVLATAARAQTPFATEAPAVFGIQNAAIIPLGICNPVVALAPRESRLVTCTFASPKPFYPEHFISATSNSGVDSVRSWIVYSGGFGPPPNLYAFVDFELENTTNRPVTVRAGASATVNFGPAASVTFVLPSSQ